jgi:hypothetical protein
MLTGLLFLHRISDNRMAGTELRNAQMFEKLCGSSALPNVALITTMWDSVTEKTGIRREEELREDYWASMITSGARMMRFHESHQSAWDILDQFSGTRRPIQLQVEMVDEGKPLVQTAAGSALCQWLNEVIIQLRETVAAFRERLGETSQPRRAEGLLSDELGAQRRLNMASEQRQMLVNC